MSIYTTKSTPRTDQLNPRATLRTCDQCHEHAPRFVTGVGVHVERLCPTCAVAADLSAMPAIAAERLQAALIDWITTPDSLLDSDDDMFYARMDNGRAWDQHKLDLEAERQARKAWVASVCPETRQAMGDRAFMAELRDALLIEWDAVNGAAA